MAEAVGDIVFGYRILTDKELGSGSFGTVLEAIHTGSYDLVAVKKISRTDSEHFSRTASREAANFQRLPKDHDNVVKVLDVKYQTPSLYIFMEKCNAGDLRKYFSDNHSAIHTKAKFKMISQISDGLAYLHTLRIIHRDLKPANILVNVSSGQAVAKITDFGLSKFLGPDDTSLMTSDVGTAAYMAPEFWMKGDSGNISYRSNVDIFAAGLVYLAILQATEGASLRPSAEEPTGGSAEDTRYIGLAMYMRSTLHQPSLTVVSAKPGDSDTIKKLKKLIRNMTAFNPDERPKAADVDRVLKAIVTLIEFEDSSIGSATLDEENETPKIKALDVSITKLKQWKMRHKIHYLHVTTDGHIYTANMFGDILLFNLTGRLLFQWSGVKPKAISSVTIDKMAYIAIVVDGADKSGTVIKLKEARQRSQSVDAWNITAYESPLGNDNVRFPISKMQNGFLAIGLRVDGDKKEICDIHILDCSKIPFVCVNVIGVEHGIRSLCGLVNNLGEQLIVCLGGYDGVKLPLNTYSLTNRTKIWQFSGGNVKEFGMIQQLQRVGEQMDETHKVRQFNPLSEAIGRANSFASPVVTSGLQLASPFEIQGPNMTSSDVTFQVQALVQAPNPRQMICSDLEFFYATDICNANKSQLFISENHNQEVLLVNSEGKLLAKALSKDELDSFVVEHMQSVPLSQYLVTICCEKPFGRLTEQTLVVWRYKLSK